MTVPIGRSFGRKLRTIGWGNDMDDWLDGDDARPILRLVPEPVLQDGQVIEFDRGRIIEPRRRFEYAG